MLTLHDIDQRARDILRLVVEAYVETGEPVGSRTLSRRLGLSLSPATVRNTMADLEAAGLLASPHASAGRLPTPHGLRLFVDGLLEVGDVDENERRSIEALAGGSNRSVPELLTEATQALSGLSRCAGLVMAPKTDRPVRHIEFVPLSPGRALIVLVTEDGLVENRIVEVPQGLPPGSLTVAGNYLNARLAGRTLDEAKTDIQTEIDTHRAELDEITSRLVASGLAVWGGGEGGQLIIRGQSNLLTQLTEPEDIERVRQLFAALETRESLAKLLDAAGSAQGVQIFIGAENQLFSVAGCSVVVGPYRNSKGQIVGALGVIGPSRLNYRRIIPMVDYTARIISRLIG